ncbi:hypothetical protein tloyanaT_00100 [Thalassotalea loyana]|uniref:MafI family immunity protein n=1 Tax=Thalassotalea loyana TaxID=280483 RepID=A0ABQ6H6H8_9GAMM|nr:hypothetical protein [Thalassotalea loyana]GLX83758.1 hypothetical protein tloyanaT_00100 [Thalassotalea loyana]
MNSHINGMTDEDKLLFLSLVTEFLDGYTENFSNFDNEENIFIVELAFELIEATLDSYRDENIPLLSNYLAYLKQLVEYFSKTFDSYQKEKVLDKLNA